MRKRTSTAALRKNNCFKKLYKNDKTAIDNTKTNNNEVKTLLMRISTKLAYWAHN